MYVNQLSLFISINYLRFVYFQKFTRHSNTQQWKVIVESVPLAVPVVFVEDGTNTI